MYFSRTFQTVDMKFISILMIISILFCEPFEYFKYVNGHKADDWKSNLLELLLNCTNLLEAMKNQIVSKSETPINQVISTNSVRKPPSSDKMVMKKNLTKDEAGCKPFSSCENFENKLDIKSIPQLVYIYISGPINSTDQLEFDQYEEFLNTVFNWRKQNPNGCSISLTYYVSQNTNNYNFVKYLFDHNHEIGINDLTNNTNEQQNRVVRFADIPVNRLAGFKCFPDDESCNNKTDLLRNLGYKYMIQGQSEPLRDTKFETWPCKLSDRCRRYPTASSRRKSFWKIPVGGIFHKKDMYCSTSGRCINENSPKGVTKEFFLDHLSTIQSPKRIPFGVHLHSSSLENTPFLEAFDIFLTKLLQINYVYIVSVKNMIDWMESPTELKNIHKFEPWVCVSLDGEIREKSELRHKLHSKTDISKIHNSSNQRQPEQQQEATSMHKTCVQGENCKLPSCFCPTFKHHFNKRDIPQIVFLAFDDHLNSLHIKFYDRLFHSKRKNPNQCPVSITLFVSHKSTEYDVVKYYYGKGYEIGVHSITHRLMKTRKTILDEASRQINNIINLAGVPRKHIMGWRSPYMETAGDIQIEALQLLGFKYDISHVNRDFDITLSSNRSKIKSPKQMWPFTFDYGGLPFQCVMRQCPKRSHRGFWEVPMNVMVDIKKENICFMTDDCINKPQNSEEVFQYLWHNFETNYNGNRAPFGLNLHPHWFELYNFTFNGLDKFIEEILKLDDVFIVSVQKMLEWIKQPMKLDDILAFKPWDCSY